MWKLLPLAIIFIVTVFNKNHTGNNTLSWTKTTEITVQPSSAWDSHSQAGKQINNHTSTSHNILNLSLYRGRVSDAMDQLMEATTTPENTQILIFCTWATCCKRAHQHRILLSLWRIQPALNFNMTPVKLCAPRPAGMQHNFPRIQRAVL